MTELQNDIDKAILALTVDDLEDLSYISPAIITVAKRVRSRLLIILHHPLFEKGFGTNTWDAIQRLLGRVYFQATAISHEMNKILMNIEVLLRAPNISLDNIPQEPWDMLFHSGDRSQFLFPDTFSTVPSFRILNNSETRKDFENVSTLKPSTLPTVALGGTFDHLHSGHKILLSMAAWITEKKLIIGISADSDALLSRKNNRELIESLQYRTTAVFNFLSLFKPGIQYDLVPIDDIYGPTAWDSDIQGLVVSKETVSGAAKVARVRTNKSLPPLEVFVIDVISAMSSGPGKDETDLAKKDSSTYIRDWISKQKAVQSGNESLSV